MTEKELDNKIDKWRKRMYMYITDPHQELLVSYAIKYGYKLAKREYKKLSSSSR